MIDMIYDIISYIIYINHKMYFIYIKLPYINYKI